MRKRKSNNDTTVALDDDCNEEEELEKKAASVDSGQDYLSVDPITTWSWTITRTIFDYLDTITDYQKLRFFSAPKQNSRPFQE